MLQKFNFFKKPKYQYAQQALSISNEDYICVNPLCKYSTSRIFSILPNLKKQSQECISKQEQHLQLCKKWIVKYDSFDNTIIPLNSSNMNKIKKSYQQTIKLQYQRSQINQLAQIPILQLNMNGQKLLQNKNESLILYFKNQKEKIKELIQNQFKQFQNTIIQSLKQLQTKTIKTFEQIIFIFDVFQNVQHIINNRYNSKEAKQKDINQWFRHLNSKNSIANFNCDQKIQIFSSQSIDKQLSNLLNNIQSKHLGLFTIQSRKQEQKSQQSQQEQQLALSKINQNFEKFIQEQNQNIYGKYQSLASASNSKVPNIQIDQAKSIMKLKCYLCEIVHQKKFQFYTKKECKKQLANQIFVHIRQKHQLEAGLFYYRSIQKSHIKNISLQKALKMISKFDGCLHIIDRQSGVTYQQNLIDIYDKKISIIEIITQKNVRMTKQKYISVQKRQHLDILAVCLVLFLNYKRKKFQIFSKSTSINTIQSFFEKYQDFIPNFFKYKDYKLKSQYKIESYKQKRRHFQSQDDNNKQKLEQQNFKKSKFTVNSSSITLKSKMNQEYSDESQPYKMIKKEEFW